MTKVETEKRQVGGETIYWIKLGIHFVRFTEEEGRAMYEYFKEEFDDRT